MIPQTGDLVRVRARQYLVEAVELPPEPGHHTLVRLSCLEDDAQGEPLEVLWEREIDARLLRDTDWARLASRGFDAPRLFSAYLHSLRWSCVTATDPRLFQAPYRAGIEVKAYQLEPLRMALGMPRVNLFIADDVGLGKTIEAGLILRELILRQKVRRCVIAVPPSVVRQWRDEMEERFGLGFVIHDREHVARVRQQRGWSVNPWTTHTRFIISHALLREEAYAGPLRDWLGEDRSPAAGEDPRPAGALLILDEAHNAAPASGARYAVDSKLTRAVRELAPRFEHKLFLSATPHNGHSNSFSALLELLDPQRFCRGVPVDARLRDQVMVRRLKSDLRALGETFPRREILAVRLDGLPDEAPALQLSRLLQRYRKAREARLATAPRGQQSASMLVITSLQKRLLSSVEAFWRTLEAHRRHLARQAEPADLPRSDALDAPGADDERADLPEDEVEAEHEAAVARATQAAGGLGPEAELLDAMARLASRARYEPDPRIVWLIEWIRENLCPDLGRPGARWLPRRVLLFTEYADTKRWLVAQLEQALRGSDQDAQRVATFHGGIGEDRREAIKAAFNAHPDKHPLRILVATDAAREGVNLQNGCADLFHLDVPWNPGRLEQRNGRIDRKLQASPVVRCHYFVLPQRAEDRVLDVLVQKTRRIHDELGSLTPVVEHRIDRALRAGIDHDQATGLSAELERVDADADATGARVHTLRHELGQGATEARRARLDQSLAVLRQLLERSRAWIGLDDRHFRDALSAALEALGAEALRPEDLQAAAQDPARARWTLPALHQRKGADPTWATTLDSLRAPRKRGQSLAEWRREAPIRPVVFRDPGNLDGEVVHLHLEHRVVQRLLGRFRSMGFRDDDLARACVLRTDAAEPRVVLLGRLSLFGHGGARLHDEILAAAALWHPPDPSRRALRPVGEADKVEVLRLVEEALAQPRRRARHDPRHPAARPRRTAARPPAARRLRRRAPAHRALQVVPHGLPGPLRGPGHPARRR